MGRSSKMREDPRAPAVRALLRRLENWSIWLDVSILAKTLPAVLSGGGAY